ncbi:MAG: hypothetical protein ACREFC_02655, partial [Stellaceae bacterium]
LTAGAVVISTLAGLAAGMRGVDQKPPRWAIKYPVTAVATPAPITSTNFMVKREKNAVPFATAILGKPNRPPVLIQRAVSGEIEIARFP